MKKALIYWFSFLLLLLLMTSCSTRKTETTKTSKENVSSEKTTDNKNVSVVDTSNVKENKVTLFENETTIERKTFSPVDPTKPSSFIDSYGNKKELNNSTYTEEKTISKSNKKVKTNTETSASKKLVDKGKRVKVLATKSKETTKNKSTERTSFNWWYLMWLVLVIIIIIIWKYKDKLANLKIIQFNKL